MTATPHHISTRPRCAIGVAALVAALITAVASSACSAPPLATTVELPPELPAPVDPYTLLDVGDRIEVVLHGHEDLSSREGGSLIARDGRIDLPLLGPITLAGLTLDEAREAITVRAAGFVRSPTVAVAVVEYAPRPYFVLGAVAIAGRYELSESRTALQALAAAGGCGEGADRTQVALLRRTASDLAVHYFDVETPGIDGLVGVEPGDVIFVRISGAGSFREEILPYLQGVSAPMSALASLIIVGDRLGD